MTIPPFPSQDLAKLVLGYLAEEQLMTAYDEFLQASPYLDALGNEYDRIFMTSLKNILAEYRALKIYVETCKPFVLRKKIFQCANLLEMVKLLVQNVDINKLQLQENNPTKCSLEKPNAALSKTNICDVCNSLRLESCTCKSKNYVASTQSNTHVSLFSIENSIETTSLTDLPGNHVTCRKKNLRVLNKESSEVDTEITGSNPKLLTNDELMHKNLTNISIPQIRVNPDTPHNVCVLERPDSLEMRQKEEFNNILNQVCNKNDHVNTNLTSNPEEIHDQNKGSMTGYSAFATGVNSGSSLAPSVIVPDSSTSENLHIQIPATKETNNLINLEQSGKQTQTKTQYLLKVTNLKNNLVTKPSEVVSINTLNTCTASKIKTKSEESKIKILSDIKVDQTFSSSNSEGNMPKLPTVRNATSTPLLQMHTIVINGTPVYKNKPYPKKQNYTKDEIMAMPTIILAPASVGSQNPVSQSADTGSSQCVPMSSTSRTLGPLLIDVTSNKNVYANNPSDIGNQNVGEQQQLAVEKPCDNIKQNENTMVKSVDITSASAPKDVTVGGTIETGTPQVFPPLRKSSSTPRRTSHVRVLDFATPRRILHETVNKCVPHAPLEDEKEVILSKSPNISIPVIGQVDNNKLEDDNPASLKENSINKVNKTSRKGWDADLRLLATVPERDASAIITPSPKKKLKPKSARKSKASKDQPYKKEENAKGGKIISKKKTPKKKVKKNNSTLEDIEIITIPDVKVEVPVKPTINIVAGVSRNPNTSSEMKKTQNKSNSDDNVDTPEMERMSLQNEIGAKLNISDLLETPYKQALYDIQMETPRFLGPDIPDDPMSDIKIMNIPTPRFLNAATPSSYSSRPTDYSSGGSYYKPEDQDYMRVHDELDCPVTSTKESVNNDVLINKESDDSKEKENMKPTRPVRECTKNVSYYNAHMGNKSKHTEKSDIDYSIDTTEDDVVEKRIPNIPITPRIKENKNKSDMSKKGSLKKRKTPVKKDVVKSFMKIKPRRPTPTKNSARGKRKSADPTSQSKVNQTRKKIANKENTESCTLVVNAAPTKSRRKSSTPRKLHCSKSFHSESSGHDSPELVSKSKEKVPEASQASVHDSDTEQLPLRWSDDGSQEPQPVVLSIPNDTEDIKHIKEYIETSKEFKQPVQKELSLHIDLVKRGFDLETAKSIERDLLDTPPLTRPEVTEQENIIESVTYGSENIKAVEKKIDDGILEKTLESDCSTSNNLQIVQNDEEEADEEIELSVYECNEDSTNYFTCSHDATKETPKTELPLLKDKYTMEVCIDNGVSIRLRATPFSVIVDQDPQNIEYLSYSYRETEMAVSSISNFDKLYTPLKESIKAQCYEIFDSTLTSLDTPLKARSPKKTDTEVTVTQIVLEVEKVEEKEKIETKKRKRVQSGNTSDESGTECKKVKPDTQLLFNSTNIQNFDIDSVLSKLHGP